MPLKHLILSTLILSFSQNSFAADCSASVIAQLKEDKAGTTHKLNCSVKLSPKDVIKKTILFEGKSGSNITLDCNGAKIIGPDSADIIKIASKVTDKNKLTFERVENVTIKNCHIHGSMRILGMGNNGEAELVKKSSRINSDHTKRAQAAAPTNIRLEKMTFEGKNRVPLYLSPGVTKVTVQDSLFSGYSVSVALYMDAESGYNKIIRNRFDTVRKSREMIAVDGSAYNIISGNQFNRAKYGVIHLYRNCGEGGTTRVQSPSHNQITGNWFPSAASSGRLIINSRSGNKKYCGDDRGLSYGSSANDLDNGIGNIIAGNFFKGGEVGIVQKENTQNYIFSNQANYNSSFSRIALCATKDKLLKHGQTTSDYAVTAKNCSKVSLSCEQGELKTVKKDCGDHKIVTAECKVSGNNNGCSTSTQCPKGYKIFKAKAACHLESESLSQSEIDSLLLGQIKVTRASDNVSQGQCTMGAVTISSGTKSVNVSGKSLKFACKEHDKNGGDCKVMGQILCVRE